MHIIYKKNKIITTFNKCAFIKARQQSINEEVHKSNTRTSTIPIKIVSKPTDPTKIQINI